MKKIISLLLCGVLSAGILAGCGKTDDQPTTVPTTGTVTEAPAEETKGGIPAVLIISIAAVIVAAAAAVIVIISVKKANKKRSVSPEQ